MLGDLTQCGECQSGELQKDPKEEFLGLGCLKIITNDDDLNDDSDEEDTAPMLIIKPFGIWDLMSSRMSLMYWSILSSSTTSLIIVYHIYSHHDLILCYNRSLFQNDQCLY